MSQKVQKYQNKIKDSKSYGKWFVRAVYDNSFITTAQLADFIQEQCTVKRSDCKAVLDELGSAFKHFFELGQKIKLDGLGIFKVGVSSTGSDTQDGATAASVKKTKVIFTPETSAVATGQSATVTRAAIVDGQPTIVTTSVKTYYHPATALQNVKFEVAKDSVATAKTPTGTSGGSSSGSGSGSGDSGGGPSGPAGGGGEG